MGKERRPRGPRGEVTIVPPGDTPELRERYAEIFGVESPIGRRLREGVRPT